MSDAQGSPGQPGLLVVTHGGLAFELALALARIVTPATPRVRALSIGWDDDLAQARTALQRALEEVGGDGGILILTDMFGGTATNLALSFLGPGIEIVTGVNLPMLVKFANLDPHVTLKEAAAMLRDQGRRAITLATEYLEAHPDPTGGAD